MSGHERNLRVLTEHVRELAHKQDSANGRVLSAINDSEAAGMGDRLWQSHGLVSAALNLAVADAETARASALSNQYKLGADLQDRLLSAAENYSNTDWAGGRNIGGCAL